SEAHSEDADRKQGNGRTRLRRRQKEGPGRGEEEGKGCDFAESIAPDEPAADEGSRKSADTSCGEDESDGVRGDVELSREVQDVQRAAGGEEQVGGCGSRRDPGKNSA